MSMNTNKHSRLKKALNIVFKTSICIMALFTTLIFILACIGSCSSKTATVKADNGDVSTVASTDVFNFGTYFAPSCNWIQLTNENVPENSYWYPNVTASSLSQTYSMACNISLINVEYEYAPVGYSGDLFLPALDISCVNNVFSRVPLNPLILLKTGVSSPSSNVNYRRVYPYPVLDTTILTGYNRVSNFNTFSDGVVYVPVHLFAYGAYYFGAIKYQFNPSFDCGNVRSHVYSSSVLYPSDFSSIFGSAFSYSYSMFINTLTFYDGGNNFFAIDFISSDAREGGEYSYFMQESKTVFFTPDLTDDDYYQAGYDDGLRDGKKEGYEDGAGDSASAIDSAYKRGKDEGYAKGFQDGSSGELTAGNFFNKVFSIFDVKIFGFMSLGDIFKIVFVFGIGIWALKVFAGG